MWFFCKSLIFIHLVFTLLNTRDKCAAQPITNLDLLTSVTDSLLLTADRGLFAGLHKRVKLRSLSKTGETNWFVEQRLTEILQRRGTESIFVSNQPTDSLNADSSISILEFQTLELGIRYERLANAISNSQPGEVTILSMEAPGQAARRIASAHFFLRALRDARGEVIWSGELKGEKSDRLPVDAIETVENPDLPFTQGRIADQSEPQDQDSKLLQTIVIAGVTGAVVYLLYALRSR